ncbi:aluminum-activated malate transporter 12 isoform X2 [Beta vulgaris subsp. vulgaris]|uniref:aluminum-activated malate transporter 12 isoform X2 n=1 Tax=Beta vulgaris subsp. vulgaris TaxID=3555 RepID=UPI0020370F13|nr:aluminum-activated malate transporter 12 isoform X2 [Beta vulgaris subsp. vulgaris]
MELTNMEAKARDPVSRQANEWSSGKGKMGVYKERMMKLGGLIWSTFWKVGREDPRRLIHAFKVGLSLTLVSLLYLLEPLFNGVGQNAIWAVMTVVVVLEFTAGATLCKGLNRGLGTVLAGSLAFFIEFVANRSNHVFRAIFIGFAVFLIACVNQYFCDSNSEDLEDNLSDGPIYKEILDSKSADEVLALYASWEPRLPRHCFRFPWKQYVKVGTVLRHFGYTIVALHGCLQTEIQTPKAVRALFKDPCIRLAAEVSKVLIELSNSIKNRRHCSPSILSNHLHEALQDLDTALKSQPRLFLNPTLDSQNPTPPNLFPLTKLPTNVAISSFKTDSSALLEWKSKRDQKIASATEALTPKEKDIVGDRRMLRPTLSKIAITSLEFAEALPFAAFASLLVETVARLDHVIDEVEELGRIAHFKEFRPGDDIVVKCCDDDKPVANGLLNHLSSHGFD